MKFNETGEFSKDFKRLSKKYKSLSSDFIEFKKVVSKLPFGSGRHFIILHNSDNLKIIKARFFCRYLKGSSLRITYAFFETKTTIHFIELYFKSEQENEDKIRIKSFIKSLGWY